MLFQIHTQLFTTVFTSSEQDVSLGQGASNGYAIAWQRLSQSMAYRLLLALPERGETVRSLRALLSHEHHGSTARQSDEDILQQAAHHFSSGWYCVLNRVPSRSGGQAAEGETVEYVTEAIEKEENPTGVPAKKVKDHWIIVELLGENGEPIPNELCRITLPDGQTVERDTNSLGRVEEYMIVQGDCVIEFPDLDKDAWEPCSGEAA